MGGVSGSRESRSWWSVLTLMLFISGLLLATAWDADGNPNTDNLPQIALTADTRDETRLSDQAPDTVDSDEPEDGSQNRVWSVWGHLPALTS